MSCLGEPPHLDHAIFADTRWEPAAVYKHLDWLEAYAATHGIPVHRVSAGDIRAQTVVSQVRGRVQDGLRWASMPLYTLNPDGSQGMIRRQCTKEFKIEPIRQKIRQLLGYGPKQRVRHNHHILVRQWFGISADEWTRISRPDVQYIQHWYPLLESRWISRRACLEWLARNGFNEPPKSACIECPFHSDAQWRQLTPAEFEDACQVGEAIRNSGGMRGQLFLHRSCRPLREVDLRSDFDKGQLSLLDECSGMCGV